MCASVMPLFLYVCKYSSNCAAAVGRLFVMETVVAARVHRRVISTKFRWLAAGDSLSLYRTKAVRTHNDTDHCVTVVLSHISDTLHGLTLRA